MLLDFRTTQTAWSANKNLMTCSWITGKNLCLYFRDVTVLLNAFILLECCIIYTWRSASFHSRVRLHFVRNKEGDWALHVFKGQTLAYISAHICFFFWGTFVLSCNNNVDIDVNFIYKSEVTYYITLTWHERSILSGTSDYCLRVLYENCFTHVCRFTAEISTHKTLSFVE